MAHPWFRFGTGVRTLLAAAAWWLGTAHGTALGPVAVVGILEGRATLLRPQGKLELAEGVVLRESDIVETEPAAFVQIEFDDGLRLGLGESSRLMLLPAPEKPAGDVARVRLLQGWMKLTPGSDKPPPGQYLTAQAAIGSLAGAGVVYGDAQRFALFVETGTLGVAERSAGAVARQARAGEFVSGRSGAAFASAARPSPEFIERMPRLFRDALPARAAKFRDRPTAPRAIGQVSYDDVAEWLRAEALVRVPMIELWRARLSDRAFRSSVLANLEHHPEWRALVVPPKKPPSRPASQAAASAPAT